MPEETLPERDIPRRTHVTIYMLAALCAAIVIAAFVLDYSRSPGNFEAGTIVHIEKDAGLSQAGAELYNSHVIRSPFLLRVSVALLGVVDGKKSVGAGDYFFKNDENVWQVADRLIHSEQDIMAIKVTFPEGISVRDMANILSADIDGSPTIGTAPAFIFDKNGFLEEASTSEGYLFPDTYLFLPNVTPETVVSTMKNNFNEKIATLAPEIAAFQASTTALMPVATKSAVQPYPRNFANIVTMASILEREASSTVDRRIIAGILWKRLDVGVPLAVDAPFMYILGKTSAELTVKDLATTSPYNTYVHAGLPPTPIGNPGLDSLTDAVTPLATPYWYYVSDKNGMIHYAATYAEHEANVKKYVE